MKSIADRLHAAGIENPAREARILVENFKGDALEKAITRRLNREPMSHILGYREFWKDRFFVNSDVLDPRADSELLIELALFEPIPAKILDLGCGSGALGLSALREFPNAHCVFADTSKNALDMALKNAIKLELDARSSFVQTDWFQHIDDRFNLILCNPPYIREHEMSDLSPELKYEPPIALTPGGDGLASYIIIANHLKNHLLDGGIALFEHGYEQQDEVRAIFEAQGFSTEGFRDLGALPRVVKVINNY